MALLFSPNGLNLLSKVRLLLEGLGVQDVSVVQINGGNSVGADGQFDVADGAGGWRASNNLREIGGNSLDGTYSNEVVWRAALFRVVNGANTIFRMNAASAGTLLTARLLSWDGAQNSYVDPQTAVFAYQTVTAGPFNLSAATVNLRWVTLGVTAGVPLTINLPALSGVTTGARLTVKDVNGLAGGGAITIDASGAETIDGAPTQVLNTNYAWITLQKQSGGWMIVGRG